MAVKPPELPRLVIREQRPWLIPVLVIAAIIGWIGVAAATMWWVRATVATDHAERVALVEELVARVAELEADNERLARAQAVAERAAQVGSTVEEQLRQSLVEKEDELADVREELAFYERLVGSSGKRQGLAVHDLELRPTEAPRVYAFRMTLLQNIQRAAVVDGAISIRVEAIADGDLVSRAPSRILVQGEEGPLSFQFKYFQQLEGLLEMPDDAQIQAVIVELRPQRGAAVSRRFDLAGVPPAGQTESS